MASDPNKQSRVKIEAFATGCAPISATVDTWLNLPNEVNPGWSCSVKFREVYASRYLERDNAIEAAAAQLEELARQLRKLKEAH